MKKLLLVILAALFLTGCQQPTIDYNNFSDIDPSRPEVELEEETVEDEQQEEIIEEEFEVENDLEQEVEDEYKIIIDTYRVYFEEYKVDLISRKETFKNIEDSNDFRFHFENRKDERNGTIIAKLDYALTDCTSMEKYNFKYGHEKTRKGYYRFDAAAAYAEYKEAVKKDLAEVDALWNEINSLIEEIDNILSTLETLTVEELIEKNNEVLARVSNLSEIDFQTLSDEYDMLRINTEINQKYFWV